MDEGIGRILARLVEERLADNTLVLFTSDNGPWLGMDSVNSERHSMARYNGPFRGMKQDVLEGGIRVPAMLRWPAGLPAGYVCHAMLHGCDWLPTLLSAAGARPVGLPVDGVNQLNTLRGETNSLPSVRFWQFSRYAPVLHCNMAIRDGKWKLYWPRIPEAMVKLSSDNDWYRRNFTEPHFLMEVENPPVERKLSRASMPELYDIGFDPTESHDLAGEFPKRVARMKLAAENWFLEVERERHEATLA
jgi:arylsulfatase A-like enzyme